MKDCAKKNSRTQTFLKIMGYEKSMELHQKRKKKMKQANWSNYVFSLFSRKLKSKSAWDHHSTY